MANPIEPQSLLDIVDRLDNACAVATGIGAAVVGAGGGMPGPIQALLQSHQDDLQRIRAAAEALMNAEDRQ